MITGREILIAISLLTLAEAGHAALGETLEEMTDQYGTPKKTSLDAADQAAGGEEEYTFYTENGRVSAVFAGGRCVNVVYFAKSDAEKFTAEERESFFSENGEGQTWNALGPKSFPTHVTADESRCAVVRDGDVGFFDMQFWKALKAALKKP
jgi:hypothetical protein